MACAANFAFANREVISHWVGDSLEKALHTGPKNIGLRLIYDVAHNIAKFEEHIVDGKKQRVLVHRKGATRAFPPHHPDVPGVYRDVGQPVIIPGDMGRCSYILVGTEKAMEETFGSTCHGAGRKMSRHAAKKAARGRIIEKELAEKGIVVRGESYGTIAEEMPEAYKDVTDVVDCVAGAGISKKVAKLVPLGVIKG